MKITYEEIEEKRLEMPKKKDFVNPLDYRKYLINWKNWHKKTKRFNGWLSRLGKKVKGK